MMNIAYESLLQTIANEAIANKGLDEEELFLILRQVYEEGFKDGFEDGCTF